MRRRSDGWLGRRFRWVGGLAALGLAAAGLGLVPQAAGADPSDGPIPLTGPDTIIKPGPNERYITYGASSRTGKFVPYVVHGSGNTVGMDTTIDGDAMPDGPGGWARRDHGLWAPTVVNHNGRFYLFYTATQKGTGDRGRKCIGVAASGRAIGPFRARANPLLCNAGGWSIDAEAFVGPHNGNLYVTYRDDKVETGRETAISVVRVDDNARQVLRKRVQLSSRAVTWENAGTNDGSHIIENPSMVRRDGRWWLFYSGNKWRTAKYATGIARCGDSPMSKCTPVPNRDRSYFGYLGEDGMHGVHKPVSGLPRNKRAPGGMSVFHARNGGMRVVWNYRRASDGKRFSLTGNLTYSNGRWAVVPE